jgi:hypothetical protein
MPFILLYLMNLFWRIKLWFKMLLTIYWNLQMIHHIIYEVIKSIKRLSLIANKEANKLSSCCILFISKLELLSLQDTTCLCITSYHHIVPMDTFNIWQTTNQVHLHISSLVMNTTHTLNNKYLIFINKTPRSNCN